MSNSLGWCFTLNNYSEEEYLSLLDFKQARYVIIGKEKGVEGTPHLQGYIQFNSQKKLGAVKKINSRAHWEATKGSIDQNVEYCSKEGSFEERGTKPFSQKRKGELGACTLGDRWENAKAGRFELLPPESIKIYEYIRSKFQVVQDRPVLDNVWISGVTGAGKSRYVRETYPDFYWKSMSKWWDGYANEDVVVLDDFAPEHGKFLGYYLKIWADHYVFNGEVKGGMLSIRPGVIVVTSQYKLYDCFEEAETITAMRRRFKEICL